VVPYFEHYRLFLDIAAVFLCYRQWHAPCSLGKQTTEKSETKNKKY
jgi:hypothetical protein